MRMGLLEDNLIRERRDLEGGRNSTNKRVIGKSRDVFCQLKKLKTPSGSTNGVLLSWALK